MRRNAIDEAAEEFADDIVADIPGTPAELEEILSEDVETLFQESHELPDDVDAVTDNLLDEELNEVDSINDTVSYLSILLPSRLSEELD